MLADEGLRFSHPVHRTQRAETKRIERQVNGRIELARVAASRLLADINIDTPFAFPTSEEPIPAGPEEAAEAIRRVWRIPAGPIDDLTAIVETAGAVVAPVDFGYDGARATASWSTTRMAGCSINTVSKLLLDAGGGVRLPKTNAYGTCRARRSRQTRFGASSTASRRTCPRTSRGCRASATCGHGPRRRRQQAHRLLVRGRPCVRGLHGLHGRSQEPSGGPYPAHNRRPPGVRRARVGLELPPGHRPGTDPKDLPQTHRGRAPLQPARLHRDQDAHPQGQPRPCEDQHQLRRAP